MKVCIVLFSGLILFTGLAKAEDEVQTAKYVDLNKYIGLWYEVASIPQSFQKQCVSNTTAEYSFGGDGLIVVNNTCQTKTGERTGAEGRAKVVDANTNAKLKVTFVKLLDWIFAFGGNYWILDVASDYSYALVGDPSRDYAWILSRTPSIEEGIVAGAEKIFREQGYDTCKILTSVQDGGFAKRRPLCEIVN